mmetsp:Transcript_9659/g.18542  ORF Transcript_9659/g.18542 Transcript_9659/m.18542 type:complete len:305 (-) Transcript_9659:162-1076(-)
MRQPNIAGVLAGHTLLIKKQKTEKRKRVVVPRGSIHGGAAQGDCLAMELSEKEIQVFAKSQLSDQTLAWAIYRSAAATYFVAILSWSIGNMAFTKDGAYWPIYLTHWTLVVLVVYLSFAAMCTWLYGFDEKIEGKTPLLFKVTWVLQNICLSSTMLVFLLYWMLVYTGGPVTVLSCHVHGVNWVMMLIDRFFSEQPAYFMHCYQAQLYALVYFIWSVIQYYGQVDNGSKAGTAIYNATDYGKDPVTNYITFAVILTMLIPGCHATMVLWGQAGEAFIAWVKGQKSLWYEDFDASADPDAKSPSP